jgi:sugar phosphate isomerase/epimerase
MQAAPLKDLSRCAIHTFTNKPWSLAQCVEAYSRAGIHGISVWRNVLEGIGAKEAGKILRDGGMRVPALVRGGFFTAADERGRQKAIDDNRVCIDEAEAIKADMIVLVVGATPGLSLPKSWRQVQDGIAAILPYAQAAGVKLAIEPLHPMYAADRSCVNRMTEARIICEHLMHPMLGIVVDVYHVWWDADLQVEIALAGKGNLLFGFHICDWRVNTRHLLTDRGLMGDGCIDLRSIRDWVEKTGFNGMIEVEIFSEEYWAMDQNEYVRKIADAYLRHA